MARYPTPRRRQEQRISIPYNFSPRSYQMEAWGAFDYGLKRHAWVWHRRSGKDKLALNITVKEMFKRIGVYYHLFPTYAQGKKAIWDGIGSDGKPFLSHFPESQIAAKVNDEMQIKLANGSIWQVVGTDRNLDNLVGPNPVGCVFSEYSIQDPRAWTLLRPILRENGGWAIFCYTPRGENHGYELFEMAKKDKEWFASLQTVDTTLRDSPGENGKPVLTPEDIEAERREGMSDDMIAQEYYCSFRGALQGAYYLKYVVDLETQGRMKEFAYEPRLPVHTAWDLGWDDSTAIWFYQKDRDGIRVIDYMEENNKSLLGWSKTLQELPYSYGYHVMPHDVEVHDLALGQTRKTFLETLGLKNIVVAPRLRLGEMQGEAIHAVRALLPRCWFNVPRCERGVKALRNYQKVYREDIRKFEDRPLHDWASHGAAAFQALATTIDEIDNFDTLRPSKVLADFNVFERNYRNQNSRVLSEW